MSTLSATPAQRRRLEMEVDRLASLLEKVEHTLVQAANRGGLSPVRSEELAAEVAGLFEEMGWR